jgi:hypothetical protein
VGSGEIHDDVAIGTDLAIMANANATIISMGTFSMWGAGLCGGEYYTEYGMITPFLVMFPDEAEKRGDYILYNTTTTDSTESNGNP